MTKQLGEQTCKLNKVGAKIILAIFNNVFWYWVIIIINNTGVVYKVEIKKIVLPHEESWKVEVVR